VTTLSRPPIGCESAFSRAADPKRSHIFGRCISGVCEAQRGERVPDKAKGIPMFMLPAYDPTAMAMLGFGILAVLGLPFIF
jgi:hypothetical protein